MVTRERLHQLVEALPERAVKIAAQVLEALSQRPAGEEGHSAAEGPRRAVFATEELRRRLGPPTAVVEAPPISSVDDLAGDVWPDDDDPDEFESTLRRWRDDEARYLLLRSRCPGASR